MSEIKGYRINGTNLVNILCILQSARKAVSGVQKEEYHRLLALEIEDLVDDIALGELARPDNSIYEIAVNSLNKKISFAEQAGANTEYNLIARCGVCSDGDDTYIMLRAMNPALICIFAETDGVIDYTVTDSPENAAADNAAREEKWKEIERIADGDFNGKLVEYPLTAQIKLDPSILTFTPPESRAKERAGNVVLSRLITCYAAGESLNTRTLARVVSSAFTRLLEEDSMDEISFIKLQLAPVLPVITKELIGAADADSATTAPASKGGKGGKKQDKATTKNKLN